MSSVIVEADRTPGPAPWRVLFGEDDGLTRIWMISNEMAESLRVGLHYHGGDEIWRVRKGRLRITAHLL